MQILALILIPIVDTFVMLVSYRFLIHPQLVRLIGNEHQHLLDRLTPIQLLDPPPVINITQLLTPDLVLDVVPYYSTPPETDARAAGPASFEWSSLHEQLSHLFYTYQMDVICLILFAVLCMELICILIRGAQRHARVRALWREVQYRRALAYAREEEEEQEPQVARPQPSLAGAQSLVGEPARSLPS
ncbi:uncharacterized protein C8Q71DRAFT_533558 [Rhodofomes roseus]|uniref:Uncharacterized protein n=1 Tax=Rhodofomes roseus TaxID=34475 RepID=A0ABQ8KK31_9APHY|nr:uncharacterized protein C8Q71DRAFT_533558 [Rhodofomes roseus]KAH9838508.1 hypothetical protein C8Q71DRAFT_533558 [Rhodofomes roseus]